MPRTRTKLLWIVPAAAVVAGVVVWRGGARHEPPPPSEEVASDQGELRTTAVPLPNIPPVPLGAPGRLTVGAAVPPAFTSVAYAVVSSTNVVVARGTLPVKDGAAATQELVIPSGTGHTVTFVGTKTDGGVSRAVYLGTRAVDLAPGGSSSVKLTSGETAGSDETIVPGSAIAAAAAASTDSTVACRSCEMSSGQGICDSPNITATSSTNPGTGEQTGIGWGCGTLPDPKARDACLALLRCLNANGCGRPGENPVAGCYCGQAVPESCIGGLGITGACIAEYHAAAPPTPGGPPAGAAPGQIAQFIATASSDPTTPIGLADNIKHCAMETHCDACETL